MVAQTQNLIPNKMITLDVFDGHIVLLTKHHYKCNSLIEGLRMIWSIRCGYDYIPEDNTVDRYIANRLYNILITVLPEKKEHIMQHIHEILTNHVISNETVIEQVIRAYCSDISHCQIKEKKGNRYKTLVKLPKPNKRVFNRILRGNGIYTDYKLITKGIYNG